MNGTGAKERIDKAVSTWFKNLENYPGWREWHRKKVATLMEDDYSSNGENEIIDFSFSDDIEKERAVIFAWIQLIDVSHSLKELEFYFRKYPFANKDVSKSSHMRLCCELYFGKFYQYKERLKKISNALSNYDEEHGLHFGRFIKTFEKKFKSEIIARNGIHHHESFDEKTISKIIILEILSEGQKKFFAEDAALEYRRAAKVWAKRTREQSALLENFTEAVATALLRTCRFLD